MTELVTKGRGEGKVSEGLNLASLPGRAPVDQGTPLYIWQFKSTIPKVPSLKAYYYMQVGRPYEVVVRPLHNKPQQIANPNQFTSSLITEVVHDFGIAMKQCLSGLKTNVADLGCIIVTSAALCHYTIQFHVSSKVPRWVQQYL